MTAICMHCNKEWNISIYQDIHSRRYVCPNCAKQGKKAPKKDKKRRHPRRRNASSGSAMNVGRL